ncbi:MAG TPA: beta-propeller fold lactonase family protein [Steroidobacteraceae bacterium]|jgi:YVTN family beta-propeller protein|nr:beta-propeller fold lactonase family protein [Steroidobacteraceae bacterium]
MIFARAFRKFSRAALLCGVLALPLAAHAGRAYVSNEDEHTVTVIDTDKNAVVQTIQIGKRPRGIEVSRDGTRLYVAVSGLPKCPPTVPDEECEKLERDLKADGIAAVDTRTLQVEKVYQAGSDPEQFDISPDGRLIVANEDTASATVLDLKSGKIVKRVPVGKEPEGVRVAPGGKYVLVTNESDNSISILDAQTFALVKNVTVGKRPRDIAFMPDGKTAYVSGEFDSSVYRIHVPEGAPVEKVIQLDKDQRPMSVRLDAKRKRLYVSTGRGGNVAVLDISAAEPKLVQLVPVGARPWGMALSPDGSRLYTANGPSNDVSVVDTATLKVIAKIPVGKSPWGVAVGPTPK